MTRAQLAHLLRSASQIAGDPDGIKAITVDGAIGELSEFHQMYSYYSQGDVAVAILPAGWRNRLIPGLSDDFAIQQRWVIDWLDRYSSTH